MVLGRLPGHSHEGLRSDYGCHVDFMHQHTSQNKNLECGAAGDHQLLWLAALVEVAEWGPSTAPSSWDSAVECRPRVERELDRPILFTFTSSFRILLKIKIKIKNLFCLNIFFFILLRKWRRKEGKLEVGERGFLNWILESSARKKKQKRKGESNFNSNFLFLL